MYSWFHIKGTWNIFKWRLYISMRAQVAVGTFFMKSPVSKENNSLVVISSGLYPHLAICCRTKHYFLGANAPLGPASSEGLYVWCLYVCMSDVCMLHFSSSSSIHCINWIDYIFAPMDDDRPCFFCFFVSWKCILYIPQNIGWLERGGAGCLSS